MKSKDIEIVHDEWVSVITDNADAARRFFGAPPGWPVRFKGFMPHRKGRVFEVLAKGLTIGDSKK